MKHHLHCSAGCEKAAGTKAEDGSLTCVNCGAPFLPCTPETCPTAPKQSSGALWEREEDEKLRQAWYQLVHNHRYGRSEAAIRTRLNLLADRNYRKDWPFKPL